MHICTSQFHLYHGIGRTPFTIAPFACIISISLVPISHATCINIFTCIHNEEQYTLFIFNLYSTTLQAHTGIIHLKQHFSIPQLYNLYFALIFAPYIYTYNIIKTSCATCNYNTNCIYISIMNLIHCYVYAHLHFIITFISWNWKDTINHSTIYIFTYSLHWYSYHMQLVLIFSSIHNEEQYM